MHIAENIELDTITDIETGKGGSAGVYMAELHNCV